MPTVMTIAGSDSGGGAGIQADLKTFAALGVYGTSVLTAITAQNTQGITAIHPLPADIVAAQIDAIVQDIDVDAVKTGMLANGAIVEVVAQKIKEHRLPNLVVDPVIVAGGGEPLLHEEGIAALRDLLIPLATVVTPNLLEAETLMGRHLESEEDIRQAAANLAAGGAKAVVIKGGHLPDPHRSVDILYDGQRFHEFASPRLQVGSFHGSGCTFASAIAACLAPGASTPEAVRRAKEYLTEALRHAYPVGHGHMPLHHFHAFWKP